MLAPGPFVASQIRPGDPYELSNGHAILSPPTGQRGGKANLLGGHALETDPVVESAGVDVGVSPRPKELRAPDLAIGNVADEPGWASSGPPLAVEYADVGQDEGELQAKILELFANGTRLLWVVRLVGERRVEIYEPGKRMRVAKAGTELRAPGILANPVPVEAMWDRDASHAATLRNLLNRKGYADLAAVKAEGQEVGREEGREEGREDGARALREALRAVFTARGLVPRAADVARIDDERDLPKLGRWVARAATATSVRAVFQPKAR